MKITNSVKSENPLQTHKLNLFLPFIAWDIMHNTHVVDIELLIWAAYATFTSTKYISFFFKMFMERKWNVLNHSFYF